MRLQHKQRTSVSSASAADGRCCGSLDVIATTRSFIALLFGGAILPEASSADSVLNHRYIFATPYTSLAGVASGDRPSSSGALQAGVPAVNSRNGRGSARHSSRSPFPASFAAIPKSVRSNRPPSSNRLDGLISRCAIPSSCSSATVRSNSINTFVGRNADGLLTLSERETASSRSPPCAHSTRNHPSPALRALATTAYRRCSGVQFDFLHETGDPHALLRSRRYEGLESTGKIVQVSRRENAGKSRTPANTRTQFISRRGRLPKNR